MLHYKIYTFLLHPVLKDYPSIAHLVQKLSDNNIQTIFAVTEEFQPVYQVSSSSFLYVTHFYYILFLVPSVCVCVIGIVHKNIQPGELR